METIIRNRLLIVLAVTDVSLIGMNDMLFMDVVNPPLMTMRTPSRELGLQAANLLIDLIDGKQPSETKRLLGAELIARSSVAKPRKTLTLAQKITAS
jgi:LacI family transcriptional regulator